MNNKKDKIIILLVSVALISLCSVVVYQFINADEIFTIEENDVNNIIPNIKVEPPIYIGNEYNYYKFLEYRNNSIMLLNLESVVSPNPIRLPVLDEHGANIYYKTNITIRLINNYDVKLYYEEENGSRYDFDCPTFGFKYPKGLLNDYFRINTSDGFVKIDPFETVEHKFNIEVYGSGLNQVFFPKTYYLTVIVINNFARKNIAVPIIFEEVG